MMIEKYIIPKDYIIDRISTDQLNLSEIPEFPVLKRKTPQATNMGFVVFFKEEEGFGVPPALIKSELVCITTFLPIFTFFPRTTDVGAIKRLPSPYFSLFAENAILYIK